MDSVQMRLRNGRLEYRSLIMHECMVNSYTDSNSADVLYVNWSQLYTPWQPVVESDEDD